MRDGSRRRMMKPWLFALALVACGGTTHDSVIKGTGVPQVAPTTPAPSITFANDKFEVHGLPAISRDREVTVLPIVEGDGGRGYPNLRIELRSESDKTFETDQVLIANDYEKLVVDGKPSDELAKRIDHVNQRLRELAAQHELVPLQRTEITDTEFVIHETWEVTYAKSILKIVFDAGHSLTFEHPEWKAPQGARVPGAPPCENPESLKAVYWTHNINAIVAEITYQGTDTCWEPGDQLHVITW